MCTVSTRIGCTFGTSGLDWTGSVNVGPRQTPVACFCCSQLPWVYVFRTLSIRSDRNRVTAFFVMSSMLGISPVKSPSVSRSSTTRTEVFTWVLTRFAVTHTKTDERNFTAWHKFTWRRLLAATVLAPSFFYLRCRLCCCCDTFNGWMKVKRNAPMDGTLRQFNDCVLIRQITIGLTRKTIHI